MTKNEMRTKLLLADGIGLEVSKNGEVHYYFYEDFADSAISRIYRQFNHGELLAFYSQAWARQSQFKEYMTLYNKICELANAAEMEYANDPENIKKEKAFDDAYKREFNYMMFLVKTLIEWTNCNFQDAKKQVITNQIHYLKF